MKSKMSAFKVKTPEREMFLEEAEVVRKEFHTDYTVVIENLPYMTPSREEETDTDLLSDADYIFSKCMGVDMEVVRVKRKSVQANNTRIMKSELANKKMVEEVLRNKSKLWQFKNHQNIKNCQKKIWNGHF